MHVANILSIIFIISRLSSCDIIRASRTFSQPVHTKPTISAVLMSCPRVKGDENSCQDQLVAHIRISPSFQVEKCEKYFILDEVYEPQKRKVFKIVTPYLIELSRGEPIMIYPLKFSKSVKCDSDAKAGEKKQTKGFSNKTVRMASSDPVDAKLLTRQFEKKFREQNAIKRPYHLDSQIRDREVKPQKREESTRKDGFLKRYLSKAQKLKKFQGKTRPEFDYQNIQFKTKAREPKVQSEEAQNDLDKEAQTSVQKNEGIKRNPLKQRFKNKDKSRKLIRFNKRRVNTNAPFSDFDENNFELLHMRKSPNTEQRKFGRFNSHRIIKSDDMLNFLQEAAEIEPQYPNKNNYMTANNIDSRSSVDRYNMDEQVPLDNQPLNYQPKYIQNNLSNDIHANQSLESFFNNLEIHKDSMNIPSRGNEENKMSSINHDENLLADNVFQDFPYLSRNQKHDSAEFPSVAKDVHEVDRLLKNFKPMEFFKSKSKLKNYGPLFDCPYKMSTSGGIGNYKPEDNYRYDSIITDPGLDIDDKITALKNLDPSNDELNSKNQFMSKQFGPLNSKAKRSFLMYADLESKDTLNDFDFLYGHGDSDFDDIESCDSCGGKNKKPRPPPNDEGDVVDDMEALCTTCGGKNKKPGNGRPSFEDETGCQCRDMISPCYCKSRKRQTKSEAIDWYSVYKMKSPLPYLNTKIRIFQKCHGIWYQVSPSIIMNSLRATYIDKNFSVLVSSHVDIFQIEKSKRLKNHELWVPTATNARHSRLSNRLNDGIIDLQELNKYPDRIVHVGSLDHKHKSDHDSSSDTPKNDAELCQTIRKVKLKRENSMQISSAPMTFVTYLQRYTDAMLSSLDDEVQTISELGWLPYEKKVITLCPHNKSRLCLNTREDKAPAMNIKIKLPFCQNSLVTPQETQIKIMQLVSDATTKDVLFIRVTLINVGVSAQVFEINVNECVGDSARNLNDVKLVKKQLLTPLNSEMVHFMIPRTEPTTEFECLVRVSVAASRKVRWAKSEHRKDQHQVEFSRRLNVVPDSTCFCIWKCLCNCFKKIESFETGHGCKPMDIESLRKAGLHDPEDYNRRLNQVDNFEHKQIWDILHRLIFGVLFLLMFNFLLGFLKAVIGLLCSSKIDELGFECVNLEGSYNNFSKTRKFVINTFLFIIWPWLRWCQFCRRVDQDHQPGSISRRCAAGEYTRYSSLDLFTHMQSDDESVEDVILEQRLHALRNSGGASQSQVSGINLPDLDDLTNDEDDDDIEASRCVIRALTESREALKKVLCVQQNETTEQDEQSRDADILVQSLLEKQIVYRMFSQPVAGLINIPRGLHYCMRGYFVPGEGTSYEFMNYAPMDQYLCLTDNGCIATIESPVRLDSALFARIYANKREVLEAGDLVCKTPPNILCLNVRPNLILPDAVSHLLNMNVHASNIPMPRRVVLLEEAALETQNQRE